MIRRSICVLWCAMMAVTLAATVRALAAAEAESKPATSPSDRSADEELKKPLKPEDKPKVLTEAIEQWRGKDYRKASINLTRLINSSKKEELDTLSTQAEKEAQVPLADLAAEVHFENAKDQSKTGAIRLQYVTTYENEPLVKKISEAYTKALEEPITAPPVSQAAGKSGKSEGHAGAEPQGKEKEKEREKEGNRGPLGQAAKVAGDAGEPQPTEPGQPPAGAPGAPTAAALKINLFMTNPKSFDTANARQDECAAFARHISYTVSLLDAKMRLDTTLRLDKEGKKKLVEEKKQLDELRRVVLTASHMTPEQRARAERMRKIQEERKQRREQQPPPKQRSQSSGRSGELEGVIKKTVPGFGG